MLNISIVELLNKVLNFVSMDIGLLRSHLWKWCGISSIVENLLIIPRLTV
jgi:hypothetical protein